MEALHALDSSGVLENTLVIIGSDHGELLGEDGKSISHPPRDSSDTVLHVPLILAGPGVPPVTSTRKSVDAARIRYRSDVEAPL